MILTRTEERAAMRTIIWTQCLAIVALGTLTNGTLLLYLTAIGCSAARTMIYLAIHPLTTSLLLLPAAFLADRYGKKRLGQIGLTFGILGWGVVALGPFAGALAEPLIVTGIIVSAICTSLIGSGWFSLLSPIIPTEIRGRFFGRLRLSFSLVSLVLSAVCAWILSIYAGIAVYQGIYAVATLAYIARWFTYRRIPELEPPEAKPDRPSFRHVFSEVIRVKNLAGFSSYVFLLVLFTAGAAALFAMIESRVLAFTETQVILLTNITLIGSMTGLFIGGRVVDRWGTRFVFAICHVSLALTLAAYLLRIFIWSSAVPFYLGTLHFLLGAAMGSIGIAITSEFLGILPQKNKSVAASIFVIFHTAGVALSALIPAWILKSGILKTTWSFAGRQLSSFDSILLGYSLMTLIFLATLGLVPSISRKSEPASLGLNRL
ncbi:MAG: MFS family permease [Verrucomicrobiales bacterium]|jgi:MFS family permease